MEENNKRIKENLVSETLPQPETTRTQTPTTQTSKKISPIIILLLFIIVLITLAVVEYFKYRDYKQKSTRPTSPTIKQTTIVNPTLAVDNPIFNNFCLDRVYCDMNEICSTLPPNYGACTPDVDCSKYNLCSRKDTLMESGAEVVFEEDVITGNGKTRIGYMLVRNTSNSQQNVNVEFFDCLNYRELCKNIIVTYPSNFQINARDAVIFPVYIESRKNLKGLSALEFTFKIGEKLSMVGVDVIFNNDKTCIYQWGGQEKSRRIYFQEESKTDWTQYCQ